MMPEMHCVTLPCILMFEILVEIDACSSIWSGEIVHQFFRFEGFMAKEQEDSANLFELR